jgi:hypothetical protein
MAGASKRDRKKESKWRQHVAGQAASGLAVRAYCRGRGLSEQSFHWWRRELVRRDGEKVGAPAAPEFVPARVASTGEAEPTPPETSAVASAAMVEIMLPGEWRLRVTGQVDRQQLVDVLDVLESLTWAERAKAVAGC